MTPQFTRAVDPILLHVLGLLDRIGRGEPVSPQQERVTILALIDQAEAIVGADRPWELARYALVSWIDEVLVDAPWDGRDWWSNNVLEVELFNTRLCFERFYVWAQEASTLPQRDALEVFYVCVVLGFRGLYRNADAAAQFAPAHGLPPDLDGWARQASLAIRLGQGRPELPEPQREITGAPPMRGKLLVLWSWLAAAMLAVCTIAVAFYASRLAE
jgi:type VI secretion system protein ImpK